MKRILFLVLFVFGSLMAETNDQPKPSSVIKLRGEVDLRSADCTPDLLDFLFAISEKSPEVRAQLIQKIAECQDSIRTSQASSPESLRLLELSRLKNRLLYESMLITDITNKRIEDLISETTNKYN